MDRGKETIDVRVPNRKLTEEEFREANSRLNKNLGEWDYDLLADHFEADFLKSVGWSDMELKGIFQLDMKEILSKEGKGGGGKGKTICPKCGYEF